jgi:hypothetical protein
MNPHNHSCTTNTSFRPAFQQCGFSYVVFFLQVGLRCFNFGGSDRIIQSASVYNLAGKIEDPLARCEIRFAGRRQFYLRLSLLADSPHRNY